MRSFPRLFYVTSLALATLAAQAQLPDRVEPSNLEEIVELIEELDPAAFFLSTNDQTQYFPVKDGGFGDMAKASAPGAQEPGAFILDAASGAALIQDYIPGQGPDCDEDAEEPLVIYYGFYADPETSVMAVNQTRRLGVVISTGTAVRYRPGPTFCEDEAYISDPASPAFLHIPMSTFGQSPRNFQAMGASKGGDSVMGMFGTSGFSARLGGYVDARILGQSTALSEQGLGGAIAQSALADAMANNPEAAAALQQMPGLLPGSDGEGALQLDLSTAPIGQIAGSNIPFTYAQVRFVHTSEMVTPGTWLEDLQNAIAIDGPILQSDPATPNGGSLDDE
ncbi:hypothetical protein RYZ27_08990 [Hyphomonas sp. FCG-A18]|uniref:hypothetical protein n=1 Tax=Hyphomonas sp. FCG-A18 TaxID=3080019 RepID=UPI002B31D36D|nr:hypothetical protein RYZ27_08990 [Hyphomonas sp. FCG-A18]